MSKAVILVALATALQIASAWVPVAVLSSAVPRARNIAPVPSLRMTSRTCSKLDVPRALATACLTFAMLAGAGSLPANAVSGGVADFVDIHDQDLSGKKFVQKDFSSCDARGVKLVGSNLKGSRFFKADLSNADLSGADLTGGSLENAKLEGAILKDAILVSSYTGVGFEKVKSIENVDFTDAQIRPDILSKLCKRPDAKGTNPVTEVDTRESLGCP